MTHTESCRELPRAHDLRRYKSDWPVARERMADWFAGRLEGRPLMSIEVLRDGVAGGVPEMLRIRSTYYQYRSAELLSARYRHYCETHRFLAESFPNLDANFGPGSLAAYLGSPLVFRPESVWFDRVVEDWSSWPVIQPLPDDPQWLEHYRLIQDCQRLAVGDWLVTIPDLVENLDTLASLRGTEELLFDLIDQPEEIERRLRELDDVYFYYYDRFFDIVHDTAGGSAFTAFRIWGPGRCAKLQCDFSAMIGPDLFRRFVQPSLARQSARLDQVIYHLDGPDAIKHLPALLEIEGIDAIQWTPGDPNPDGTDERWYPLYEAVLAAGKRLWIPVADGGIEDWIRGCSRLVERFGATSFYFNFLTEMSEAEGERLLETAERCWH